MRSPKGTGRSSLLFSLCVLDPVTLCSPEASARQSLQSPSCTMIALDYPMGIFMSTDWNVSLLPGKSSGLHELRGGGIHKNQGACLKLPPITTSHRTGERVRPSPCSVQGGRVAGSIPLPKPRRASQAHPPWWRAQWKHQC